MQTCPVCDSKDIQLFMTGVFDSESTNVMECTDCGLQYLDPMMTDAEEADYYDSYYRKQSARHFKAMHLEDLQQRAYAHYEQYRSVYIDLISDCKTILEIGSGSGGFIKFVREHRPDIKLIAIERCSDNLAFINQCFGDKVTMLDDVEQVAGVKFDCICAFGVFEHIKNSREFLASMAKHLDVNGKLALLVPNKMHPLVYAYSLEEFKKFTYMKQHYFTFTEKSFQLLAQQTRLKVINYDYIQVWGLDNHISWLNYRKPRDFSDITKLLSKSTLDSYNQDMSQKKMTDVMLAVLSLDN